MGLELEGVHVHQREEGTNRMVLTKKNPYVRFVQEGFPPILIQAGVFYGDGGDRIKDIPDFVLKAVGRMSPDGRARVGLPKEGIPKFKKEVAEPELDLSSTIEPPKVETVEKSVVDHVYELNPADDAHWTKAGAPDLNVLKERCARYVSRAEVEELTQGYRRPTQES